MVVGKTESADARTDARSDRQHRLINHQEEHGTYSFRDTSRASGFCKFILLDEPFSGIDPIAVLDLQKIISNMKAAGIGVLMTDHNVRDTLSVTDRAYIINEGRIFRHGTPEQLGSDSEVRRVYLGESFSLV